MKFPDPLLLILSISVGKNISFFVAAIRMMQPIIQEDKTGCGFASVATLAGVSYQHVKTSGGPIRYRRARRQTLVRYQVCSKTPDLAIASQLLLVRITAFKSWDNIATAGAISNQMAHQRNSLCFLALGCFL